jgi:manganese transport protein
VLLLSNGMALLLQTLAARLGVVTGYDLAQGCRREYPRPVAVALWFLSEIAIAATDLAEIIRDAPQPVPPLLVGAVARHRPHPHRPL